MKNRNHAKGIIPEINPGGCTHPTLRDEERWKREILRPLERSNSASLPALILARLKSLFS
jgi:hypothetical protein